MLGQRESCKDYSPLVRLAASLSLLCAPLWVAPGHAQSVGAPPEGGKPGARVFRIEEVDVGDEAWGQNLLRIKVKNIIDQEQPFWVHIGGRYQRSGRLQGFGMGMEEPILLAPHEERVVEHPYWIPPQLGELSYTVKCVLPTAGPPLWEQEPFFREDYTVTYETPNNRCNELTPFPQFMKDDKDDWAEKYRHGARILPFRVISTEHFVFYVLPDSFAKRNIEAIQNERERVMKEICTFLGTSLGEPINFFLFPDAPSKRWCMMHEGDGLAFGTTIAEIYSEETRVDPAHELTHIVASRIGSPPALFNEGFAVYMQDSHEWNGEPVDITAAKLLREGKLTLLEELIKRTEIGSRPDDGEVAYPQSASFVKFLIDRYGREQFLKLYGELRNGAEDNVTRFKKVLDVEFKSTEQQWRKTLSTIGH